jgi:hypothetical protein
MGSSFMRKEYTIAVTSNAWHVSWLIPCAAGEHQGSNANPDHAIQCNRIVDQQPEMMDDKFSTLMGRI